MFNKFSDTGQGEWFAQMEMTETDKYKSRYPVEMMAGNRLGQEYFPLFDEKTEIGQHQSLTDPDEG